MENTTIKCDYERDFKGCVLGIREYNGYHDSDFYATVWDEERQCVREIEDGTTRAYAPSKYNRADATEEVRAKARNWYATNPEVRDGARRRLDRAFAAVRLNDAVKVVAGRKVAIGTIGEVFWIGADSFRKNEYRIGMRLADGSRVYTAMGNVEKLHYAPPSEDEITEEVKRCNPF